MTAAFLPHQQSDRARRTRHGFVWRLLHFFDLDHHFHLRELFTERKHIDRTPSNNVQTSPPVGNASIGDEDKFLPSEADAQMAQSEDDSSCGLHLKSLISEKMSKKMKKSEKKKSFSSQQRFSEPVHHDHVLSNDPTWSSEAFTLERSSSEADSSSGNDLSPLKSEGFSSLNASQRKDCLELKKLGDQFLENQTILMEKLVKAKIKINETINGKKKKREHVMRHEAEDLSEVLELLNANTDLFHKILHDSALIRANNLQDNDSESPHNLTRCGSYPGFSRFKQFGEEVEQGSFRSKIPNAKKANGLQGNKPGMASIKLDVSRGFNDFKQKMKEVINESKNESARVSLDGVLHKIPYGHNAKDEPSSVLDGARKNGFAFKEKMSQNRGFRRSASLASVSLENYASLIEFGPFVDPQKGKTETKSSYQSVSQDNNPVRWGRTLSNPEFFSFRIFNHLEVDEHHTGNENSAKKSSSATVVRALQKSKSNSDESQVNNAKVVEIEIENVGPGEADGNSDDLLESRAVNAGTLIEGSEVSDELETGEKPTKLSPVSVLESSILEGNSQLCSNHDHGNHLNEPDHDFDFLNVRADKADVLNNEVPEFKYVRDVLDKYSSGDEEFLNRLCLEHSSKSEASHHHPLGLVGDQPDMHADRHHLLFDLINEVLLDIYTSSSFFFRGFSHFHQRTRPIPVGPHVLEEVWTGVRSHLASRTRTKNSTFEDAAARDLSKQDGWLNIRQDTDFLGLELEAWILDDLTDEIVDDFKFVP